MSAVSRTDSKFRPRVGVVEWLGNEAYAYMPFVATRTQLMVSLDGASRIAKGDEVEIHRRH